ncbi:diacylglycerol kinase family protein [Sporolactobacillus sp. THM7-7]|nr:diacylglycerol kinase family protein [Sporolactobacillus sp. THM7-7]
MKQQQGKDHKPLSESFKDALAGFLHAVRTERNLLIQFLAAVIVIAFSLAIRIPFTEMLIVLILIGGVISLELMNTAVERLVDLVTREKKPLAGAAKDLAAASVWWFSMIAAAIYFFILLDALI